MTSVIHLLRHIRDNFESLWAVLFSFFFLCPSIIPRTDSSSTTGLSSPQKLALNYVVVASCIYLQYVVAATRINIFVFLMYELLLLRFLSFFFLSFFFLSLFFPLVLFPTCSSCCSLSFPPRTLCRPTGRALCRPTEKSGGVRGPDTSPGGAGG